MADETIHVYPQLNNKKVISSTVNESSPLQVKEEKKEETQYRSTNIQRPIKKYEKDFIEILKEEQCLGIWLGCCCMLIVSLIPIAEIIILIMYFHNDDLSPLCPLQATWCYFILIKLIFEVIAISAFAAYIYLKCTKTAQKIAAVVGTACLLIWNIILTDTLFKYKEDDTYDAAECDPLIDFILFETVSVWAVILILLCIGCWWWSQDLIVSIISCFAHTMHNLVIHVDLTILYQWGMSIVEIVFLAIYYDHYGACNPMYSEYILVKFVCTVVIIGAQNFLRCCSKRVRDMIFKFLYVLALIAWCVAASVMFWMNGNGDVIVCRTDGYTSHYYDFILLNIILGYVVIGKELCGACWVQLSNFLGSPKVVEKYGEFARSNTAEWLRYKESQRK